MFLSVNLQPYKSKKHLVFLDGIDISNICYAADDKKGIALCHKKNILGKRYLINNKIAREKLTGIVEFKKRSL